MPKTTIVLEHKTRDRLKKYGRKDQTYDQIVTELLNSKKINIPLDDSFEPMKSSELLGVKRND
jgi:hypothetical protein